jgi:hypothetical protein
MNDTQGQPLDEDTEEMEEARESGFVSSERTT